MTEIRHIRRGDLVILSTGEEAVTNGIVDYSEERQRYRIEYKKPVTGWPNEEKQFAWWYNEDGTFVRSSCDAKNCADIVKVIHNESLQAEDK